VAGRTHPFFGAATVGRDQLQEAQMVALSQQTPTGALIRKHLARMGVEVEPVVSSDDIETVRRMVEMGLGAAFLPDMVTDRDLVTAANPQGRLSRCAVEPPLTRRVVLVTWSEVPASRAVAAVIEEARHQAGLWPGAAKPKG
jgi:LysR family transcriptional regulator, transcriptional activator of the cysJI operon